MIVFLLYLFFFCQTYSAAEYFFSRDNRFVLDDKYKEFERFPINNGMLMGEVTKDKRFFNGYLSLVDIAKKECLSDEEKLKEERVSTEYFKSFKSSKDQKKKNDIFVALLDIFKSDCNSYPLKRVLLAACIYTNPDLSAASRGSKLLIIALNNNDCSLAKLALIRGADPNKVVNGYSPIYYCKAEETAKLLVSYGASINEACCGKRFTDPIHKMCNKKDLLPWEVGLFNFYLQHTDLGPSNENGKKWIKELSEGSADYLGIQKTTRLKELLEKGCAYDEKVKAKLIERVEGADKIFKKHEESVKGPKPAKRRKIE